MNYLKRKHSKTHHLDDVIICSGYLMIAACIIALFMENSSWSIYYEAIEQYPIRIHLGFTVLKKTFLIFVNEGLMTIFFFLIGLEIKSAYVNGPLNDIKKAALPIFAALGGMIVPALFYILLNYNQALYLNGWAIPMATDIAFSLAIYSMVNRQFPIELRLLLTTLAIIDDIGAILVIGLFYTDHLSYSWMWISMILCFMMCVFKYLRFESVILYLSLGLLLWYGVLFSGLHATLAGVIVAFFIPYKNSKGLYPIKSLEKQIMPWVYYIVLPLFAFLNSGIDFRGLQLNYLINTSSMGIILGLLFGKPIGVMLFSWFSTHFGLAKLSEGLDWKMILGVGFLTGIGFTMSLFITSLSFETHFPTLMSARFGILVASILSGLLGFILLIRIPLK